MSQLTQLGRLCIHNGFVWVNDQAILPQQITLQIIRQVQCKRPSVYFQSNKIPKEVFKTLINAGFVVTDCITNANIIWSGQNSILASQLNQHQYISSFDQFNYLLNPQAREKLVGQYNEKNADKIIKNSQPNQQCPGNQSINADSWQQNGDNIYNESQQVIQSQQQHNQENLISDQHIAGKQRQHKQLYCLQHFSRQDSTYLNEYQYYFDLNNQEFISKQEIQVLFDEVNALLNKNDQTKTTSAQSNNGQAIQNKESSNMIEQAVELKRLRLLQKAQFQELSIYMDDLIPLVNGKIFTVSVFIFLPETLTEEVYVDPNMIIKEAQDEYNHEKFSVNVYKIPEISQFHVINMEQLNKKGSTQSSNNKKISTKETVQDTQEPPNIFSNEYDVLKFSIYKSSDAQIIDQKLDSQKTLQKIKNNTLSSLNQLIKFAFKQSNRRIKESSIVAQQFGFYEAQFRFIGDFEPVVSDIQQIFNFHDKNEQLQQIYSQLLRNGLNYLSIEVDEKLIKDSDHFNPNFCNKSTKELKSSKKNVFISKQVELTPSSEEIRSDKSSDQQLLFNLQEKENQIMKRKYLQQKTQNLEKLKDSSFSQKSNKTDTEYQELIDNYIEREFGFSHQKDKNCYFDEEKVSFIKQEMLKYNNDHNTVDENVIIDRKFVLNTLTSSGYQTLYDYKAISRMTNELFNYKKIPYAINYQTLTQFEQQLAMKVKNRIKMNNMLILSPNVISVKHFIRQSDSERKRNYFKQLAYIIALQEINDIKINTPKRND